MPGDSEGKGGAYRLAKRAFDIVFSLAVIIISLVPSLALCLAIRLESAGGPLYSQVRIGRGGRPFRLFKLRTMVPDADNVERYLTPGQLAQWEGERKVDDDPRITRLGRFLRRTSLDELPQFLNVLAGRMSVVGPRPIVEDELSWYGDDAERLLSVRPGITGYWQVMARNGAGYEDGSRQALELCYVDHASASLDLSIMARTLGAMAGKTGK